MPGKTAAQLQARTARIHRWLQAEPGASITDDDREWLYTWGSEELRSLASIRERLLGNDGVTDAND